jgi:hypothetical protein
MTGKERPDNRGSTGSAGPPHLGSFSLTWSWSSSGKSPHIPNESPLFDHCQEEELTTVFSATYPFVGPLAQLGRELCRRTINEPFDFVKNLKNAMVCGHNV